MFLFCGDRQTVGEVGGGGVGMVFSGGNYRYDHLFVSVLPFLVFQWEQSVRVISAEEVKDD